MNYAEKRDLLIRRIMDFQWHPADNKLFGMNSTDVYNYIKEQLNWRHPPEPSVYNFISGILDAMYGNNYPYRKKGIGPLDYDLGFNLGLEKLYECYR